MRKRVIGRNKKLINNKRNYLCDDNKKSRRKEMILKKRAVYVGIVILLIILILFFVSKFVIKDFREFFGFEFKGKEGRLEKSEVEGGRAKGKKLG